MIWGRGWRVGRGDGVGCDGVGCERKKGPGFQEGPPLAAEIEKPPDLQFDCSRLFQGLCGAGFLPCLTHRRLTVRPSEAGGFWECGAGWEGW